MDCSVLDCSGEVPSGALLCRRCWRVLPKTTKTELRGDKNIREKIVALFTACMAGMPPEIIVMRGTRVIMGGSY